MIENNKDINYTDLNVIFEDNHIIVVEKVINVSSQADKSLDIDMLSLVKEHIKYKYDKPGNVYVGLVHRLDRPVGGVMVFAKTSKAAARLSEIIRNKGIKKEYIAVVNGRLSKGKKLLKNYLLKDEVNNMSKIVKGKEVRNSKEAILEYEALYTKKIKNKEYTLVKIDLHTGRHHQIRVQMAGEKCPIYGDQKYGRDVNRVGDQLALFAYKLTFKHPVKDEVMEFKILPTGGIWEEFDIYDYTR